MTNPQYNLRLQALGIELFSAVAYLVAVTSGNKVFLLGHIAKRKKALVKISFLKWRQIPFPYQPKYLVNF